MLSRSSLVAGPLALTMAFAAVVIPGATPVEAQASRLRTKSTSTFTLNPRKDRVDVTVTLVITNNTPSTVRTGPCSSAPSRTCRITTNYYTDSWGYLAIQHGARNLKLRGPGIGSRVANTNETYTNYQLTFSPIQRGQTARIRVTYQLPAARPRSENRTRITDAYAHFCWHGQPTKDGTVTAVLPRGYQPTTQYANVNTKRSRNKVRITPKRKGKPGKTYACTDSFDRDEVAETQTVSPSGQVVTVLGWPEDPEWSEVVTASVETTLPALEQLIGAPIPGDGLTILEVASQALGGYAGDFSNRSGNVRVGEGTEDPIVITHELAHAWFNDRTLGAKWMFEGAAEWVARATNGARCDWRARPGADEEVPKLRRWRHLGPEPTDAERDFVSAQYFLACDIYERLESLLGIEGVRAVNTALLERTPKYGGTVRTKPPKPDWREWLDAVDELGMISDGWSASTLVEDILIDNGIARPKDLEGRVDARRLYHSSLRYGLGEHMPVVVRDLLDDWRFEKATDALAIAEAIVSLAGEYDRANDADSSPVIGARLATANTVKALRQLRKDVAADPAVMVAPEPASS